jgi:hypothetical protein
VRIVWPHHPLYLTRVPLVEFWRGQGERAHVVELPDGSHTRIPVSWTDDDDKPPGIAVSEAATTLSVTSARELMELLGRLRNRGR